VQKKLRSSLDPEAVRRALQGGPAVSLMQALGLVTSRGGASADANRKIKQVTHFLRQLEPAVGDLLARHREPVVVDAAAGKSYLGLALYDVMLRPAGRGRLIAVESRPTLVERVQGICREQGWTQVESVAATIADAPLPERIHLMLALHACDTATDEAIIVAVRHGADHVALVPCCQAEVARQLAERAGSTPLSLVWDHPLHRREFGAQLTNAIRASVLRCFGYEVTVTELAGTEHSPKNELILGRRVARFLMPERERLAHLLEETGVAPRVVRELLPELLSPRPSSQQGEAVAPGSIQASTESAGESDTRP
jgi:hypothetical protein